MAETDEPILGRLAELYRVHADAVYAVALRITGSPADAEDVLQDVFVGLPRALVGYREQGRFDAWLRRIAARTALMRLRAARRRHEEPLEDHAGRPETQSGAAVDRIALERALAGLPDALRVVFVLREVEGFSHDEIADLLGISPGASATRLSRAWSALRKALRS